MGKAKQYLEIVAKYEKAPEWDFVAMEKATRQIVRERTFKAHDPRILAVLEGWERDGLRLGFYGSDITQTKLLEVLGGTIMAVPTNSIALEMKDMRPTGPWGMLAKHPKTGDYHEGIWTKWNRKSIDRWAKLYEGLGYEILLPVPGTKVWTGQRAERS